MPGMSGVTYGQGSATTGVTAATGTSGAGSSGDLGLDKNAFLQLLVAQLRYQNPLNPTDGSQYMAQMAQFATVEQLEHLSQAQTEAGSWQQALAGEGMIGRHVEGSGPGGVPISGVVSALQLTASGPLLVLGDGGTLPVSSVTKVDTADTTTAHA